VTQSNVSAVHTNHEEQYKLDVNKHGLNELPWAAWWLEQQSTASRAKLAMAVNDPAGFAELPTPSTSPARTKRVGKKAESCTATPQHQARRMMRAAGFAAAPGLRMLCLLNSTDVISSHLATASRIVW
jgi:hypothetical protein